MTNLKKVTITFAVVFLVCMVVVFALLPLCIDDLIDTYNEIINEPIDHIYNEYTLDEDVKKIGITRCPYYIETRKSPDNLIHIKTLDAGLMNVKFDFEKSENNTDLFFNSNFLNPINKENLTKFIKLALNDTPSVIIYMPEDASLVSYYLSVRNPYTYKNYPSINDEYETVIPSDIPVYNESYTEPNIETTSDDTIIIGGETYSKEYLSDRTNLIGLLHKNKNRLMDLYEVVENIDNDIAEINESDNDIVSYLLGYIDSYNDAYIDILRQRLDLIQIAYMLNSELDKNYFEDLVYSLSNYEQSLSVSNLRIKIANAKYKTNIYTRETLNKNKANEQKIIDECNAHIPALLEEFNQTINFIK